MGIVSRCGLSVLTGNEWPGISYFTTLRQANVADQGRTATAQQGADAGPFASFNLGDHVGDAPEAVQASRRRLALALPQEPVWLKQVHGIDVFDADEQHSRFAAPTPVADAAVTSSPHRVLCIMTADCLPVVLTDFNGRTLGIAHAGWRGLAAGVLENTLDALRAKAPAGSRWRAWIGPAIGQAAFEVGAEVRAAFVEQDAAASSFFIAGASPGKWQADLAGLAALRLDRAGVAETTNSACCTYTHPELFYSYRRDGQTGRMATVAWLHGSDLP